MDSFDGRIHQAMALAEAGQIDEARAELAALVRADKDNTAAWAALAQLSDTPKDAIYCLKQVLRAQPDNEWARSHLQRLTQQEPSPVQAQAGEEPSQPADIPQSGKPSRVPTRLALGAAGVLAIGSLLGGLLLIRGGSLPGLAPQTGEPGLLTGTSPSMASPSIPVSTIQATTGQATPPPAPGYEPGGAATAQVTVRAIPTGTQIPQGAATTPTSSPTPSPTEAQVLTPTDYPTATDPPQPPDVPTDEPSPTPGPCDCYGASLTCKDFDTQAQAQACYDYCLVQTDIDIFNLDSNQNGVACENLP